MSLFGHHQQVTCERPSSYITYYFLGPFWTSTLKSSAQFRCQIKMYTRVWFAESISKVLAQPHTRDNLCRARQEHPCIHAQSSSLSSCLFEPGNFEGAFKWCTASHVFQFYCLPDNYEVIDASLDDIKVPPTQTFELSFSKAYVAFGTICVLHFVLGQPLCDASPVVCPEAHVCLGSHRRIRQQHKTLHRSGRHAVSSRFGELVVSWTYFG